MPVILPNSTEATNGHAQGHVENTDPNEALGVELDKLNPATARDKLDDLVWQLGHQPGAHIVSDQLGGRHQRTADRGTNLVDRLTDKPLPVASDVSETDMVRETTAQATGRVVAEQLGKTRQSITVVLRENDSLTSQMQALYAKIKRNRLVIDDLRKSEAILEAAVHEGSRPDFHL